MNKKITKIVLTGGPCGGKTSAVNEIRAHFGKAGYTVLAISEVATDFIGGGVSPFTCGCNRDYQEIQVSMQLFKEDCYMRAAATMTEERILIICDRGVLDNLAYIDAEEFFDILGTFGYDEQRALAAYDAVFHMESAASAGLYNTDTNSARYENAEEAAALDTRIYNAWHKHPHYHRIKSESHFDEKIQDLIAEIEVFLGTEV